MHGVHVLIHRSLNVQNLLFLYLILENMSCRIPQSELQITIKIEGLSFLAWMECLDEFLFCTRDQWVLYSPMPLYPGSRGHPEDIMHNDFFICSYRKAKDYILNFIPRRNGQKNCVFGYLNRRFGFYSINFIDGYDFG